MKISKETKRFFKAEIDNEKAGGISPSTLNSALDSLEQGYEPEENFNIDLVEKELHQLINKYDANKKLIDLI